MLTEIAVRRIKIILSAGGGSFALNCVFHILRESRRISTVKVPCRSVCYCNDLSKMRYFWSVNAGSKLLLAFSDVAKDVPYVPLCWFYFRLHHYICFI